MSTKTTFKRVALVAVASMGFGVLTSVAPANATFTGSVTPNTTSLTVVGGASSTSNVGIIRLNTANGAGDEAPLFANETITVSVVGVPTGVDSTMTLAAGKDDINFAIVTGDYAVGHTLEGSAVVDGSGLDITAANTTETSNLADGTAAGVSALNTYSLAMYSDSTAVDMGFYTVRIRLTDSTGFITDQTIKVQFVTSAASAGAVITPSVTGAIYKGSPIGHTTNNKITATLRDANGGLIQVANSTPTAYKIGAPVLTAALVTKLDAVLEALNQVDDNGTAGRDHVAGTGSVTQDAKRKTLDGVYGITTSGNLTSDISTTNLVRVRFGNVSATAAVTLYGTVTPITADSVVSVSAAGITAADLANGTPYSVPLTTTSAVVSVLAKASTAAQVNAPITFIVTWSGNQSAGDVSPKSATPTTVITDSSGVASITLTNKNPSNGAKATVAISGFTAAGQPTSQVIDFARSFTTTVSTTSSQAVKIGATTVVTATVTDQFGKPVAGEVLQPAITGANANTTALATVTTDAAGTASVSVTDAKGVEASTTLGSDAVKFTATTFAADGTTRASGTATLTYFAAVPVIATMTAWYSLDETPAADTSYLPAPAAGIYDAGTKLSLPSTRDNSMLITAGSTTSDDLVAFQIRTGAKLVPVVITTSKGAFILGSIGQQVTTRTVITNADGYANFVGGSTTSGANTFTATAGTVSVSAAMWIANASTTQARTVTLTQNATTSVVTATVTDRYGNPVSGGSVQVSTNNGTLGNGQLTTVYTTDTTGSISVLPVGTTGATVTARYTTASADVDSIAGYVGTTAVESTLAAGIKTATLAVADSATSSAAAEAATDAAAEATDAANAATDAANAAAEAADAATAAAQDAADAVAALSVQVSEQIAALSAQNDSLRKQLIALTNLIIKIQKKVKA
jgi:hypothetical protein